MASLNTLKNIPAKHPVVVEARKWLKTPYRHQASSLGVGADCLGLVRGIYRSLVGNEPETLPAYSRHWAEYGGDDELNRIGMAYFEPIEKDDFQAGDILLFKWRPGAIPKHLAIATSTESMIHAHQGLAVCEVAISRWWLHRMSNVYRYNLSEFSSSNPEA